RADGRIDRARAADQPRPAGLRGNPMENTDARPDPAAPEVADGIDGEIETLSRQLGEAEARLAEMRDTVLRERAEMENQRKRLQRDLDQARRFANEKLLADLLQVLDNLERGLAV